MDWFEKKISRSFVITTFSKAVIFGGISIFAFKDKVALTKGAAIIFCAFLMVTFIEFFAIYLPNYQKHKALSQKHPHYLKELNLAINEIGMERLLYSGWILNWEKEES